MSADSSSPSASHAALAFLLGLHGLLFATIFPLGPQIARLWHPGVDGFAALAATLPFTAAVTGILARHATRLPRRPRTLALLTFGAALPAVFARDYGTLLAARFVAGVLLGLSIAAIHRILPVKPTSTVSRIAPRVTAFGLPLCIVAATAMDWRAAFVLIALAALALAFYAPAEVSPDLHPDRRETAPAGLAATTALAFVSAAYLTVISGFLVFNAGHTEWHIGAVLTLAAALSFAVLPSLKLARRVLRAPAEYELTLLFSALSLVSLLFISRPFPAVGAVALLALFLNANAARHIGLAGVVVPRIEPAHLPAHQAHTQLAHHFGSGLGCLCTGLFVHAETGRGLVGMPMLLLCALTATLVAAFCPRFLPSLK